MQVARSYDGERHFLPIVYFFTMYFRLFKKYDFFIFATLTLQVSINRFNLLNVLNCAFEKFNDSIIYKCFDTKNRDKENQNKEKVKQKILFRRVL